MCRLFVSSSRMVLVLLVFVVSGCALIPKQMEFNVNVNSISDGDSSRKSYVLFSGDAYADEEDLQYKEFVSYIDEALSRQGYKKADSIADAQIAIAFLYGIGEPVERRFTASMPTWGQTGVSSSRTTGRVTTYGNQGSYSSRTTYTPTYGVTGSQTISGVITTYDRFMVLKAFDVEKYAKTEKEVVVWETTVTSRGSSGDLRLIFPVLVAASQEHLGKDTGQTIHITLREKDKRIKEVKGTHPSY